MKTILVLVCMAMMMSCSPDRDRGQKTMDGAGREQEITNLVPVAKTSPNMPSHPLVCVEGGDYPNGVELIFSDREDPAAWVHAVFPESVKAPDELDSAMVLQGHFQKIQERSRFEHKQPPEDYRYFVVTSWAEEP